MGRMGRMRKIKMRNTRKMRRRKIRSRRKRRTMAPTKIKILKEWARKDTRLILRSLTIRRPRGRLAFRLRRERKAPARCSPAGPSEGVRFRIKLQKLPGGKIAHHCGYMYSWKYST